MGFWHVYLGIYGGGGTQTTAPTQQVRPSTGQVLLSSYINPAPCNTSQERQNWRQLHKVLKIMDEVFKMQVDGATRTFTLEADNVVADGIFGDSYYDELGNEFVMEYPDGTTTTPDGSGGGGVGSPANVAPSSATATATSYAPLITTV